MTHLEKFLKFQNAEDIATYVAADRLAEERIAS